MKPALIVATLLLAATTDPPSAHACSPPFCRSASVAPPDGSLIPASVTALPYYPTFQQGPKGAPPKGLELRRDDGSVLAATTKSDPALPEALLLVPAMPLQPATHYRLHYLESCAGGPATDGGTDTAVDVGFTVSDAVPPLPTMAGALSVASTVVEKTTVGTGAGSCTTELTAAVAHLALVPSSGLAPFLPVTRFTLTVDGKPWAETGYGGLHGDGTIGRGGGPAPYPGAHLVTTVFGACDRPAGSVDDLGLLLGAHHAELRAHVAGATSDPPPLAVDFVLTCGGPAGDSSSLTDAGMAKDAPAADDGSQGARPAGDGGCGCRAAGRASRPGEAALLTAALALLLGARRRRRAR